MFSRLILLLPRDINLPFFKDFITDEDYIIAVDGGIKHAQSLEITPHLWLGDFDSCTLEDFKKYQNIPRETHSKNKDYLDTELALSKAYELHIKECVIIGGMGGRIDHQLGLFMLPVAHLSINFIHTDGFTYMQSVSNHISIQLDSYGFTYLSIIPITDLIQVNLQGTQWLLNDEKLSAGMGRSISNEPIEKTVTYSQKSGIGWLVLSH